MHPGQSKVVELVNFECYGLLIDSLAQQSKAVKDLQEARFLHVVASEVQLMQNTCLFVSSEKADSLSRFLKSIFKNTVKVELPDRSERA